MHKMEILSDKKALCHGFVFLRNPVVMVWIIIDGCFGSDSKELACNEEDLGSIPGSGRAPGVGNGNPRQYSGLENSMDRGAWGATVPGVAKSRTELSKGGIDLVKL